MGFHGVRSHGPLRYISLLHNGPSEARPVITCGFREALGPGRCAAGFGLIVLEPASVSRAVGDLISLLLFGACEPFAGAGKLSFFALCGLPPTAVNV